jgi:hypothetical protein
MNPIATLVGCLIIAITVTSCAKTEVSGPKATAAAEVHMRPDRVLVFDFSSNSADLPPDSALAQLQQERTMPQSDDEIALGRRLGDLTATYLIDELKKNGIPAINGSTGPMPRVGDGVIRGEFVTIDEGSRAKRMLIGFGAGSANLQTLVEAFEMTPTGLMPLGSARIDTAGGRMPGILVPVGVGAAAATMATSAAVGGASNILQEAGPESIRAAAKRTAEEIAKIVAAEWKRRGWR